MGDIYAGGEAIGTLGATYGIGTHMEELDLAGIPYYGANIDMQKYFDQINRDLVYKIMRAAGMPEKILETYKKFQEELEIRSTVGRAIGQKYRSKMGVPQGDPFSMLAAAIVMRPWVAMMRDVVP